MPDAVGPEPHGALCRRLKIGHSRFFSNHARLFSKFLNVPVFPQEVLGLDESGHDYFLQFTDARPDTGGLSGATPSEAMTWGKVDPQQLPDTVTCYVDSTVALPLLTAYALARHAPRKPKRLMDRLADLTAAMEREYHARRRAVRPE